MPHTTNNTQQGNFIYMLVGLLMLLVLAPTVNKHLPINTGLGVQLAFMSIMIIGVWSLHSNKRWFPIGISLALAGIALSAVNFFIQSKTFQLLGLVIVLMFCILSVIIAMRQILFSGRITVNKLVGSVCIYLLLGVIWALLYSFINQLTVNAFNGMTTQPGNQVIWDQIYFSFVTLTTLGYGDISPKSDLARSLVYLEAICGQFYMAILVASLVGAHVSGQYRLGGN